MKKTITTLLVGLSITGAVAVGGTALAASSGDGSGTGQPTGGKAAKVCENKATLDQLLQGQIAEINHRIEYFTNVKSIATNAGKTKLADRAQKRIDQLQARLTKVQDRLTKLDTWAASHCTTTTTAPANAG